MYGKLVPVVLLLIVVISYFVKKRFFKSPREMEIQTALNAIFEIKKTHHDIIVKALDGGATDEEHQSLLEEKSVDVLKAIEEAENSLDIVIDKNDPTVPGRVKLVKDNL